MENIKQLQVHTAVLPQALVLTQGIYNSYL